jgi:hypothetical protein
MHFGGVAALVAFVVAVPLPLPPSPHCTSIMSFANTALLSIASSIAPSGAEEDIRGESRCCIILGALRQAL